MRPDFSWSETVLLIPICRGMPSQCQPELEVHSVEQIVVAVPIYPWTMTDRARTDLNDAVINLVTSERERCADLGLYREWTRALEPTITACYPGSPAAVADPLALESKCNALPWQLADDPATYGAQAGHWIVVDGSLDQEIDEDCYPTEAEAQEAADRINAEDPLTEQYHHWFALHMPESWDIAALVSKIAQEAA